MTHPIEHNKQRTTVTDGHAVVVCKECGEVLYDGPAVGLLEWLNGGPAPWSPAANQ